MSNFDAVRNSFDRTVQRALAGDEDAWSSLRICYPDRVECVKQLQRTQDEQMKTVSEVYPTPWLRAEDLQGAPRTVVVEGATVEQIRQRDGTTEPRIVVSFVGKDKRLICNKTQAFAFQELTGAEAFDTWAGTAVVLAPDRTRSGQNTIAVRAGDEDFQNPFQ